MGRHFVGSSWIVVPGVALPTDLCIRPEVWILEELQFGPLTPGARREEEIIRFTQERQVEALSLIEDRQAEVIEIEVNEERVLTGRTIQERVADIPTEVVIGAIVREQNFVIPRGDTVIESGDHVILFVAADAAADVTAVV